MREKSGWKLLILLGIGLLWWLSDMDGFRLSPKGWLLILTCVVLSVQFVLKKLGKRSVTCSHCGREHAANEKECPHCGNKKE